MRELHLILLFEHICLISELLFDVGECGPQPSTLEDFIVQL